jgi:hypothetical protein
MTIMTSAPLMPELVSLCRDRDMLLAQASDGTVVVLADPHPMAVDVVRAGASP